MHVFREMTRERTSRVKLLVAMLAVVSKDPAKVLAFKVTQDVFLRSKTFPTQIAFELQFTLFIDLLGYVGKQHPPVRLDHVLLVIPRLWAIPEIRAFSRVLILKLSSPKPHQDLIKS